MITNVIIDFLKNKDISQENKNKFIRNLDLSYSDIFELKGGKNIKAKETLLVSISRFNSSIDKVF